MNPPPIAAPPIIAAPPLPDGGKPISPAKALRRLYLMVFLRGRSARGLRKDTAPRSVAKKLAMTLVFYGLFGMFALSFIRQPTFSLALYLHGMTFVFLGMFVAASAGELLFNKEEGDILAHRPIHARTLLWAKISVLVQVALWIAVAFNLGGFITGMMAPDGGVRFLLAHAISTVMEALFCAGFVVLTYQLCLRWFGRERLDGLMTTAQVAIAIFAVMAGQILPRAMIGIEKVLVVKENSWWLGFLPPAWFAGLDDALGGSGVAASWALAAAGFVATVIALWLAFGKLAGSYETGLQTLSEVLPSNPKQRTRRRWIHRLVNVAPLRWWLRDSVTRASFLLVAAYLVRDRDVKLRIYPGIAPMMIMAVFFLFKDFSGRGQGTSLDFGIAFASLYLGLVPMLALSLLQYSQQWQASDLFRVAPIAGPAPLCDGARRAVLLFLTAPFVILLGLCIWFFRRDLSVLLLMVPGLMTLPIYASIPCVRGQAVPLSIPTEEAKSARRGLTTLGTAFVSMALAWISYLTWTKGWFQWLLLIEAILATTVYLGMRAFRAKVQWSPAE
jgi:hypothetical protein